MSEQHRATSVTAKFIKLAKLGPHNFQWNYNSYSAPHHKVFDSPKASKDTSDQIRLDFTHR